MEPIEREHRLQTICLLILCTVGIGFVLHWLRPVMIPFVLAAFISLALAPLAHFLIRSLHFPTWIAIASTLIVAALFSGLLAALASASAVQLLDNVDTYQAQIRALLERGLRAFPFEPLGLDPQVQLQQLSSMSIGTVGRMLVGTTNAILDIVSKGMLVFVFAIYLLIGQRTPVDLTDDTWSQIRRGVHRYLLTKLTVSAVTGLLVGLVLATLGIDLALVFGLMAFLLNFIPSIGSVIATLLPLPVVLMSPDVSTTAAVLAIAIPGVIQFTVGNAIEPRLLGQSLDLHPVTILLALIIWGMLWGIAGMLLATPITAILKLLFEKLDHTAPIADVLAGRLDRLGRARTG